jgi:signal transduction histidine kinase
MAAKEEEMRPAVAGEDAAETKTSQPGKVEELYQSPNFRTAGMEAQIARMHGELIAYTMFLIGSIGIWLWIVSWWGLAVVIIAIVYTLWFFYMVYPYLLTIKTLNSSADILCCGSRWFFPAKNRGSSSGATYYDWSLSAFLKPMLQHMFGYRFWNAALLRDYHKAMAIAAALRSGDVVLVRGEYLVNLAKEQKKLPRRQDLPNEATLS